MTLSWISGPGHHAEGRQMLVVLPVARRADDDQRAVKDRPGPKIALPVFRHENLEDRRGAETLAGGAV